MSKHFKPPVVTGSGGGSGKAQSVGGGQIAQNTLQSNTVAHIIEMLGEGPIQGLLNGAQSIYFNETPLQNEDGSYNFGGLFQFDSDTGNYIPVQQGTQLDQTDQWLSGVSYSTVNGLPTQDVLPGFPSQQTTTSVNEQIKKSIGPIVRTIEDENTTSVLVSIGIPNLSTLDPSTGDLNGADVGWTIEVAPYGGEYETQVNIYIVNEKCTSLYLKQSKVTLPAGGAPWNIRVTRTSPDEDQDINIQNQTWWEDYTEQVEGQFMYPNTALVGLAVNSEFFGSTIPTRTYMVQGLITDVPSNYDPVARTYTGVWDGTFKQSWHSNPVWVFYALLTNTRWGIGEFVDPSIVDKWGLYAISQYCDEMIPSGFTNTDGSTVYEPRYTYNGVINSRAEAYKVLQDVASCFRGMAFWSLGTVFASADMPADPVTTFSTANVVDGHFKYSGTAMKSRHSVAAVSWNDPNDFYRPAVELVPNPDMIRLFGWRQLDIAAPGCTSRGQANRYGKWILDTEEHETETVQFSVSWDNYILQGGVTVKPGDVIYIADPRKTGGVRIGGRIKAVASTSEITLDSPFTPTADDTYSLTVAQPDGTIETQPIGIFDETGTIVTLGAALSQLPQAGAQWVISGTDVNPRTYRVLAIEEQDVHLFKITALFYDPTKYARVEGGLFLAAPTYVRPSNTIDPPSNPNVTESTTYNNGAPQAVVTLSWTPPTTSIAAQFKITANGPNGQADFGTTAYSSIDIYNLAPGDWTFYISSVSVTGLMSTQLPIAVTVQGWAAVTVPTAGSLSLLGGGTIFSNDAPTITWTNTFPENTPSYPLQNKVRVYDANTNALLRTETVTGISYTYAYVDNLNDGGPRRNLTFTVTAVSLLGVEQSVPATLTVSNPQPGAITPAVSCTGDTIDIQWTVSDNDYAGSKVWLYVTSGADITTINPVYTGPNMQFSATEFAAGVYYVRVGAYDSFGTDSMSVGPEVQVYCTGINLAALSSELQDYLDDQLQLLKTSNDQTQGIIANAASEQDAANWLDKYNTRSEVSVQVAQLTQSLTDNVNSLLSTISGDVATLNATISDNYGTLNSAINTAQSNAESYTDSAIASNNTTIAATYATQSALSEAQSAAVTTAEGYTDSSIASLNSSIQALYATQSSVSTAVANAITAAESNANDALTAYETTASATFATQTALSSGLASTLSSAESSANSAISSLQSQVNAEISGVSATVLIDIGSPTEIILNNHGFIAGQAVTFSTTGALPTGMSAGTTYYVIAAGMLENVFEISTTPGGAAVNTSGTQSGTQTCTTLSLLSQIATNAQSVTTVSGSVTTLSNTLTANYTTTSGMNSAINSAISTAESYTDSSVATLTNTLTSNYTTTSGMNSAIAVAKSAAESYTDSSVAALSNTLTTNYSTTSQMTSAINSAQSTAESYANNAVANLSSTLTTNYTTTTGMNSAISSAQTAAETFATNAVATLSNTLTSNYTTTTGMNSAIATAQSTAESYTNSAISSLSSTLTASIDNVSASGQFQVIATASDDGTSASISMQVSATANGVFTDAGIQLAAFVDTFGVSYSQLQLSADQTQIGIPGETGGDFFTPFSIQSVNSNLQMALVPGAIPDGAIGTRAIAAGATRAFTTLVGSDVTKTESVWNNSGNGEIALECQFPVSAGSALIVDFDTVISSSADVAEPGSTLAIVVNGTTIRQITVGPSDDANYNNQILRMRCLASGLVGGTATVEAIFTLPSGTSKTNSITLKAPQFIIEEVKNPSVTIGSATIITPSITYQTTLPNGTATTWSAVPIGTANINRNVVVALFWYSPGNSSPTLTVGGVQATSITQQGTSNNGPYIALFVVPYATGTTADMVVSSISARATAITISVWSVISASINPTSWGSGQNWDNGDPTSAIAASVSSPQAGEVGVFVVMGDGTTSAGFTLSSSGADTPTVRYDQNVSGCHLTACDFGISATASKEIFRATNTNAANFGSFCGVSAIWQ